MEGKNPHISVNSTYVKKHKRVFHKERPQGQGMTAEVMK